MSLRDRCAEFMHKLKGDSMQPFASPTDDLVAFVQSEIGRSADDALEDTSSLILYFSDNDERTEFVELVQATKPGMVSKPIP